MAASTTRGGLRSSSPNQMKFILVGVLVALLILGFKHYSRGTELVEFSLELEDAKGRYVTCAANLRKAHAQVAILQGKLEQLKEENEKGRKSVEARENELEKVEKQLNAAEDENKAFETEVETLKENVTKCADRANSLASENDVFRNGRDSQDQKLGDLGQQNDDLKAERSRLEQKVEELRSQLSEAAEQQRKQPTLGSVTKGSPGNSLGPGIIAGVIEATNARIAANVVPRNGTEGVGPSEGRLGQAGGEVGGDRPAADAAAADKVADTVQVHLEKRGEAGEKATATADDEVKDAAGEEGQGQVGVAPGDDHAGEAGINDADNNLAVGQAPVGNADGENEAPADAGVGGQVAPPDNRLVSEELLKRGVGLHEGTGDTGPQDIGNPQVQNDNFDNAAPRGDAADDAGDDDGLPDDDAGDDLTDDAGENVDLPDKPDAKGDDADADLPDALGDEELGQP